MGRFLDLAKRSFEGKTRTEMPMRPAPYKPKGTTEAASLPRCQPSYDIEDALAIIGSLEALPAQRSATATEIAETLHGTNCTLTQIIQIYRICEALRAANIVILGQDGYGYRIALGRETKSDGA
jgi:hypothetical protein